MAATTISNSISTGVTLGTGTYGSPLTITSTGTVALATGFYGVFADNAYGSATVVNQGTISGGTNGIVLNAGGFVDNQAGRITGDTGVFIRNAAGTVTNTGVILATDIAGVYMNSGGTVDNDLGLIQSNYNGVRIRFAPGTVTNTGTIISPSLYGIAVYLGSDNSNVNNIGGLIQGNYGGIAIYGVGGTVVNSGTIVTTGTGFSGGGYNLAGVFLAFGGTVVNSGTIIGLTPNNAALRFNGTDGNLLVLENGYQFVGTVAAAGTANTLELHGTSGDAVTVRYGTFSGSNFQTFRFGLDGYATLEIANTGALGITISGFDQGSEEIHLTGIGNDGTITSFNTVTDQVVVTGSDGSVTLQFDSIDGMNFTTASDGGSGTELIACFRRGTRIRTPDGEVPVEALAIGDPVVTAAAAARPIKWIGRRSYDPRFIAGNRGVLPIRIEAGALAEGVPARDLFVSPEHAMVIEGGFLPALLLVNGATIRQVEAVERLEYFHLELDSHDVIFAEGAAAESFVDFGGRAMFHNSDEFAVLYPNAEPADWEFYASLLERGAVALPAVRAALLARAARLGRISCDPDLHLVVDGKIVRSHSVEDRVHRFIVPSGPAEVRIASRSVLAAESEAASLDPRRLGVPVERIVLCGAGMRIEIGPDCPALGDGFHRDERSHRWTDGRGKLPASLFAHPTGNVTVELRIGATDLHYPVEERIDAPAPAMPEHYLDYVATIA